MPALGHTYHARIGPYIRPTPQKSKYQALSKSGYQVQRRMMSGNNKQVRFDLAV